MENNKWVLTDNDCFQYIRRDGMKYKMIQYIELDLTEEQIEDGEFGYIVLMNEVDLKEETNEYIANCIDSYSQNIVDLINEYGKDANEIIAEYILENEIIDNSNIIAEFEVERDAVNFIEKYISIDKYTNV